MNWYHVQILLARRQHERLAQIAREVGKSLSEVARELIRFALRERQRRQMERAAQVLPDEHRSNPDLTAFTTLDGAGE
ncbi:hypothetical protein [uncultured Thermanaerothrix sp.]|uniref:hypothetical protein n=1 Tax=uncultured Thermanaerothrix sp. TaxID=1195149 RepID=UPI00260E12ED|nr:hypothetical protein [uncultured Thermanaerothrix sp.]